MAKGFANQLPVAYEYNIYELPTTIKQKYRNRTVPHWVEYEDSIAYTYDKKLSPQMVERIRGSNQLIKMLERYINLHREILSLEYSIPRKNQVPNRKKSFVILRDWEEAGAKSNKFCSIFKDLETGCKFWYLLSCLL